MAIKINILAAIFAACFTNPAHADDANFKALVDKALMDGSSEGQLTGLPGEMFRRQSNSKMPILIHLTKIKDFSNGCGRLRFDLAQQIGVDKSGAPIVIRPWADLNLCPGGHQPIETAGMDSKRMAATIVSCRAMTAKGVKDAAGNQKGAIVAFGCPAGGISRWRYEGNCFALKNHDTSSQINGQGEILFKINLPEQCAGKENRWIGTISQRNGNMIGIIKAYW